METLALVWESLGFLPPHLLWSIRPLTWGATLGFELVGGVDKPVMRSACSQQQKKDLSVYDFNADDSAVEAASEKYSTRTGRIFPAARPKSNPKEESEEALKYKFLQACKKAPYFSVENPSI